jgi:hypothetical protein
VGLTPGHAFDARSKLELALALTALLVAVAWLAWRFGWTSRSAAQSETPAVRQPPDLPPVEHAGDPELDAFLARQYQRRPYSFRTRLASGQEIAVDYTLNEDWVDVAARRSLANETLAQGPYEQFGYHMRHGRWSFGAEPPNAAEISAVLVSHLGDRSHHRRSRKEQPGRGARGWRPTAPKEHHGRLTPPSQPGG